MARISQPGVFADFENSDDPYTKEHLQTIRTLKEEAVAGHRGMPEWGDCDIDEEIY